MLTTIWRFAILFGMAMKRKMIWVDEEDQNAVTLIRQRFGCESESQAWRMAVRWLAAADKAEVQLPPVSKHSKTKKELKSLRGLWRGAFPKDYDIEKTLREIRGEWEKEWAIGPDGRLDFVEGKLAQAQPTDSEGQP
jgi:hypothetical protein